MFGSLPLTLLPSFTGDEFFTSGKGREALDSTRASQISDRITSADAPLRQAFAA
jgi:hypothetical protein